MPDGAHEPGGRKSLEGKVAVVTGGAGGVGEQVARTLAAHGAFVVIADLDGGRGESVAASIRTGGNEVAFLRVDTSDEEDVGMLADFALREAGGVDVLVNNAAALGLQKSDGSLLETSWDTFRSTLHANVGGPFLMCQATIPFMMDRGGGSIINIASITALVGEHRLTAYGASKAAVAQLTRAVATQYGHRGIRCNTVAPSYITTRRNETAVPEGLRDAYVRHTPSSRLVSPQDVADLVLFLADDRSRQVTGQLIVLDGGMLSASPVASSYERSSE